MYTYFSPSKIYDVLDYGEPQANAFRVHIDSISKFSEAGEKFWEVFISNSCPSIFYMDDKGLRFSLVECFDLYMTSRGKLICIFDEID